MSHYVPPNAPAPRGCLSWTKQKWTFESSERGGGETETRTSRRWSHHVQCQKMSAERGKGQIGKLREQVGNPYKSKKRTNRDGRAQIEKHHPVRSPPIYRQLTSYSYPFLELSVWTFWLCECSVGPYGALSPRGLRMSLPRERDPWRYIQTCFFPRPFSDNLSLFMKRKEVHSLLYGGGLCKVTPFFQGLAKVIKTAKNSIHRMADFCSKLWEFLGVLKQSSRKLPQNCVWRFQCKTTSGKFRGNFWRFLLKPLPTSQKVLHKLALMWIQFSVW